jgi:hypothetical protein
MIGGDVMVVGAPPSAKADLSSALVVCNSVTVAGGLVVVGGVTGVTGVDGVVPGAAGLAVPELPPEACVVPSPPPPPQPDTSPTARAIDKAASFDFIPFSFLF